MNDRPLFLRRSSSGEWPELGSDASVIGIPTQGVSLCGLRTARMFDELLILILSGDIETAFHPGPEAVQSIERMLADTIHLVGAHRLDACGA